MRRIGEVVQIAQGLLIVRCPDSNPPAIGTVIVDQHLDPIGRVVDVFGPIDRPYLGVKASDSKPNPSVIGTRVYARSESDA